MKSSRHWLWLLAFIPLGLGMVRLRFDVEVLDLLPDELPVVHGLKLFQQHFANARELIITVRADNAETAEASAHALAEHLRRATNLVAGVTWQPPWLEHPDQAAELLAFLWFNQPPETFGALTNRLALANLAAMLENAREQLATSMSPAEIAQLSYDPYGLTHLPEGATSGATAFGPDQEMFASNDDTFRIVFVQAASDLASYRECFAWLKNVKKIVAAAQKDSPDHATVNYTGRPEFVSEIAGGMERDITGSVGGTSLIIAVLFWVAHRRGKPMIWLLTLLALILAGTLALGGLIFGTISVVSMGFAAILLGLAVDYAVVHYQEALAHPQLSITEIRRAIAPSIFWAATTTITAFLVLNFSGLPGLAQLGSLVGVGVALSALVMIFTFLPPLFPDRRKQKPQSAGAEPEVSLPAPLSSRRVKAVGVATVLLVLCALGILLYGLPQIDPTANALRPRHSSAYTALEEIKKQMLRQAEPFWLIVSGRNENEVARRLDAVKPALDRAVNAREISNYMLPNMLWPRSEFQSSNRETARKLVAEREHLRAAAQSHGFAGNSLILTENMLNAWQRAEATPGVFWPTNELSRWVLEKLVARTSESLFALALLYPSINSTAGADARFSVLHSELPRDGVWLSGWELLGEAILSRVRANLWKVSVPMIALVLISLWLAFRRLPEILLSLGILALSGLCLLAVMRLAGWSWNLLNLMALPLILGTGVDYSIFMQLALRRHHGDLQTAHRSVGRALLLCGGTAIAGFGSLAWSSNAGMASLGQVCAVGVAANMLISVLLLPVWWRTLASQRKR